MADFAEPVEQQKKRTFRKFTYRGVELDDLLEMGNEELVKLFRFGESLCIFLIFTFQGPPAP